MVPSIEKIIRTTCLLVKMADSERLSPFVYWGQKIDHISLKIDLKNVVVRQNAWVLDRIYCHGIFFNVSSLWGHSLFHDDNIPNPSHYTGAYHEISYPYIKKNYFSFFYIGVRYFVTSSCGHPCRTSSQRFLLYVLSNPFLCCQERLSVFKHDLNLLAHRL